MNIKPALEDWQLLQQALERSRSDSAALQERKTPRLATPNWTPAPGDWLEQHQIARWEQLAEDIAETRAEIERFEASQKAAPVQIQSGEDS